MRSQAQINASRTNGAKSRGPITAEGKARSAPNATRHGLLSRSVLPDPKSQKAFNQLREALIREFEPHDPFELLLVEKMASFAWRQRTVRSLETATLAGAVALADEKAAVTAAEIAAKTSTLELCLRYDARFDSEYERTANRLIRYQRAKLNVAANRTWYMYETKVPATPEGPTETQQMALLGSLSES
jgi:hypothetical protein